MSSTLAAAAPETITAPTGPGRRWASWGLAALALVGTVTFVVAAVLDVRGDPGQVYLPTLVVTAVVCLGGWWLARRVPRRTALVIVAVGAVAFRLAQVWVPPELSDDLYRYLWDGQVQLEGINPYAHAPADPELAHLRDEQVWPEINRRSVRTIYPPVAQASFLALRAVGIARPITLKVVWIGLDLLVVWLLVRVLRRQRHDERSVILYAWNPMIVLAFAHAGHLDVLVVLAVVGALLTWQRNRPVLTGGLLGLAGAIKLFPLLLLPAFLRDRGGTTGSGDPTRGRLRPAVAVVALVVVAVSYLPYVISVGTDVVGFLTTDGYLREEGYLSGRRFVLAASLGVDGVALGLVVGAVVALWALRSQRPAAARATALLGAALLLTTPYPWYATTLVALAVAAGPWVVARGAPGVSQLLWPTFAIGLEVIYISIAHPFGPTTTTQRRWLIVVTLAALGALLAAARRRSQVTTS